MRRLLALALVSLLLAPGPASGDESEEARLRARLKPELATPVIEVVRSAAAQGLPTAPLVARALEGASRQAGDAAILEAVRGYAAGLAAARRALGSTARAAGSLRGNHFTTIVLSEMATEARSSASRDSGLTSAEFAATPSRASMD